MTEKIKSIRS